MGTDILTVDLILLVAGLAALIAGAEFLVRGASSIASRLGISPLVVGLTIVSFGTSMPELLVSFIAGAQGRSGLAVANILGSNIFNVLVVLGVAAMIRPLEVARSTVISEIPFSLMAAILVGFLANAALFSPSTSLAITRIDGAVLTFFFALFMLYVYQMARESDGVEPRPETHSLVRSWVYVILAVVALYVGGELTVQRAVALAQRFGVSDAVIGLTIVAAGTSMPELVTSAVAAFRRQLDLAVGNVVGSNIFNLLWVLGVTATVNELPFNAVSNNDIIAVIGSSTLIILAIVLGRTVSIGRLSGACFIAAYVAYLMMTL